MTKKTSILFTAITLGLAWAMRGHFGHEWGASWAGAIGVLAVLLTAKRGLSPKIPDNKGKFKY